MQGQPNPAGAEDEVDASVLELLVDAPCLWAMDEVARELGDDVAAADAVARLYASGLVHRLEGFVFASRAAHRSCRLRR